jgi:hypothetical protein
LIEVSGITGQLPMMDFTIVRSPGITAPLAEWSEFLARMEAIVKERPDDLGIRSGVERAYRMIDMRMRVDAAAQRRGRPYSADRAQRLREILEEDDADPLEP